MNKNSLLVIRRFEEHYPNPPLGLNYRNAWELLVATVLAAQTRDVNINKLTPALFERYPGPKELAMASITDVEMLIKLSGTYRQKAKRITEAAKVITEKFGGKIPNDMDSLLLIPGVARKTANVIMSQAFNNPVGLIVDTHVLRVTFRLNLTSETTPEKVEKDLARIIPKEQWGVFENRVKAHGQQICQAPKPLCEKCFLNDICPKLPYAKK